VKDGKHEDAEEFLGLYLDALDEELVELRNISTHKPASTSSVEDGQPEVGKRDYTVRYSFSTGLDIADICMDTNRRVQSSCPSRVYSVDVPIRPYARQAIQMLSLSKPGDHSNSTSRSVSPPFSPYHPHISRD
jgi:hypothetical protein